MKNINILLTISIWLVISIIFSACTPNYTEEDINCNDCYKEFPEYIPVEMQFKISSNNRIAYTVYEGYIDNSPIILQDTAMFTYEYIDLKPERYYTIKAEYNIESTNEVIYVINEVYPRIRRINNVCGLEECYILRDNFIDLRLRTSPL